MHPSNLTGSLWTEPHDWCLVCRRECCEVMSQTVLPVRVKVVAVPNFSHQLISMWQCWCYLVQQVSYNNNYFIQLSVECCVHLLLIEHFFFYGFIDRIAEDVTGHMRWQRGRVTHLIYIAPFRVPKDTQQRARGQESNPGPLQRGRSLCTWDACSTTWAKRRPDFLLEMQCIQWVFHQKCVYKTKQPPFFSICWQWIMSESCFIWSVRCT